MKFAYADPPYLGCAKARYGDHAEAWVYDTVEGHKALIERLVEEFPDGWALSLHTPSLRVLLPLCPPKTRVLAWVKPHAFCKPGVEITYAWEPVFVLGGRHREKGQGFVRDWLSCNVNGTTQEERDRSDIPGAKPVKFTHWLMDVLNVQEGDEFVDLFPGSGLVTAAFESRYLRPTQLELVSP